MCECFFSWNSKVLFCKTTCCISSNNRSLNFSCRSNLLSTDRRFRSVIWKWKLIGRNYHKMIVRIIHLVFKLRFLVFSISYIKPSIRTILLAADYDSENVIFFRSFRFPDTEENQRGADNTGIFRCPSSYFFNTANLLLLEKFQSTGFYWIDTIK